MHCLYHIHEANVYMRVSVRRNSNYQYDPKTTIPGQQLFTDPFTEMRQPFPKTYAQRTIIINMKAVKCDRPDGFGH